MQFPKIRFQGDEFILVDSVICTIEQFKSGYSGYAFLSEGLIYRHFEIIGSENDIEHIGEVKINLTDKDLVTMISNMFGETWYNAGT